MLIYVQPVIYSYRLAFINSLSELHPTTTVLTGPSPCRPQCDVITIQRPHSFLWIFHFLRLYLSNRTDLKVFLPAYTPHIGILSIAFLSKLLNVSLYVHGQALFKKPCPTLVDINISRFWLFLSNKYISYSNLGLEFPFSTSSKVVIVFNRFECLSDLNVGKNCFENIRLKSNLDQFGLLFIGRDRPRSNLNLLISSTNLLFDEGLKIHLHIVGTSGLNNNRVSYYGSVMPPDIPKIANFCHLGVYPGDSGLSILHYMCLGLCPITHSSTRLHCGPEPAYVSNNINGCTFERSSLKSLTDLIRKLYMDTALLYKLSFNALEFAIDLHRQPYSHQISKILSE